RRREVFQVCVVDIGNAKLHGSLSVSIVRLLVNVLIDELNGLPVTSIFQSLISGGQGFIARGALAQFTSCVSYALHFRSLLVTASPIHSDINLLNDLTIGRVRQILREVLVSIVRTVKHTPDRFQPLNLSRHIRLYDLPRLAFVSAIQQSQ